MNTLNWVWVAEVGAIPLNEGRRVFCANREIALFNLGKEYLAIDNRCPHKQGPLADGIVAGRAVFCPLHNLKINLSDGCAMAGGAGKVNTYPVRLEEGKIFVGMKETVTMKEITVILRPSRWLETKRRLAEAGIVSYTQRRVYGHGKQRGIERIDFIPKRLIVIMVAEDQVETAVQILVKANQQGAPGDGKIFISPVEQVIRIRTGEAAAVV